MDRKFNNIARISDAVDKIYEMRNRMFHHEPIFDGVLQKHGMLLRVIRWIEPELEATVRQFDRFPETFSLQPEGVRDRLELVASAKHNAPARSLARENLVKATKGVLGASRNATDAETREIRELTNALLDIAARPVPAAWVLRSMAERLTIFAANRPSGDVVAVAASRLVNALDRYLALDHGSSVTTPGATHS